IDLTLPFRPGTVTGRCTQGPGGVYSHKGITTSHALDLAMREDTEVVAAASGTAYVFQDSPDPTFEPVDCPSATSKGFGNHINIDHGNGLFTLYAHLKTIEPNIDGRGVERGQRIGTVDSTGWSCGHHLHF